MTEEDLERYVRRILKRGLFLTLIAAVILLLLGRDPWAKGLVLGGLASAANFYLMARLMPKLIGPRGKAARMSLISWLIRFAVMGAALAIAHYFPRVFSFIACAAGLFAVQLSLVLDHALTKGKNDT